MSSAPLVRSAPRLTDRCIGTSGAALPTDRRAGCLELALGELEAALATVTVQVDSGPLGSGQSPRIIARSLPNGHTHQTYDWGRSNAKFRMQKCAWCCLDKGSVLPYFWPWSPLGDAIYKQRQRLAGYWCIAAESRASRAFFCGRDLENWCIGPIGARCHGWRVSLRAPALAPHHTAQRDPMWASARPLALTCTTGRARAAGRSRRHWPG